MTEIARPGPIGIESAADLLTALIEIPSVNPAYDPASPGEDAVGDAIGQLCASLGCTVTYGDGLDQRRNVVARLAAKATRHTLLIEGHLDTVGLPAGQGMPQVTRTANRIFGRGACDVKGGLTAALLALAELADDRPACLDVVLLGAIDEEHRFRGITDYLADMAEPDAAIVLEPTELEVVNAHNGVVRFEVIVRGRAAHTSRPAEGRNAITDATAVITRLEHSMKQSPGTVLTVTTIGGGTAINVVPDVCRLGVDLRIAPSDDPHAILAGIEAELATLATSGVSAGVDRVLLLDAGMDTPLDTTLVRTALDAADQPAATRVPFGTDGSKLARAGVPTIVFGPGSIRQAHSDREWVELNDVVRAAQILIDIVRRLDKEAAR